MIIVKLAILFVVFKSRKMHNRLFVDLNSNFNFNPVINYCESEICLNGATCTNAVNRFSCSCVAGYTGYTCQSGKLMLVINIFVIAIINNSLIILVCIN